MLNEWAGREQFERRQHRKGEEAEEENDASLEGEEEGKKRPSSPTLLLSLNEHHSSVIKSNSHVFLLAFSPWASSSSSRIASATSSAQAPNEPSHRAR